MRKYDCFLEKSVATRLIRREKNSREEKKLIVSESIATISVANAKGSVVRGLSTGRVCFVFEHRDKKRFLILLEENKMKPSRINDGLNFGNEKKWQHSHGECDEK